MATNQSPGLPAFRVTGRRCRRTVRWGGPSSDKKKSGSCCSAQHGSRLTPARNNSQYNRKARLENDGRRVDAVAIIGHRYVFHRIMCLLKRRVFVSSFFFCVCLWQKVTLMRAGPPGRYLMNFPFLTFCFERNLTRHLFSSFGHTSDGR